MERLAFAKNGSAQKPPRRRPHRAERSRSTARVARASLARREPIRPTRGRTRRARWVQRSRATSHGYNLDVDDEDAPLRAQLAMAEASAARLLSMAVEWIRVGYVQSNFNADNCGEIA